MRKREAAAEVSPVGWVHVPAAPPTGRSVGVTARRWVGAVAVAVVGPVVRVVWESVPGAPLRVGLIVGLASVLSGVVGERRWWARAALAVGAGVWLRGAYGEFVALWAVMGVMLGDWAVRRWSPLPRVPPATAGAIGPVAVLAGVAAWSSWGPDPGVWPLVAMAAAVVVTAIGILTRGALDAVAARGGVLAGGAVSVAGFGVLSVPLVVVPWVAGRLARVDNLAVANRAGAGWTATRSVDLQPRRLWAADAENASAGSGVQWRRARLSLATVALLGGAIAGTDGLLGRRGSDRPEASVGFRLDGTGPSRRDDPSDAAEPEDTPVEPADVIYRDAEWYPTYSQEISAAMKQAWTPLRFRRMRDMSSVYVNIVNGDRRSWVPPECECPTRVVWLYGGSTVFGFGQRDEYTIPSELARAAWGAGIRLEVVNRGVPGDAHWREGMRLAWDLTRYPAPDLVVFYDGANDTWATTALNGINEDIDEPLDPVLGDIERVEMERTQAHAEPLPDGVVVHTPVLGDPMSIEELARMTVTRYDSSRRIARDVAAANDLPVEFFWQPTRFSRPPVEGELGELEGAEFSRSRDAAIRAAIPPDVRDLTGVFDGNTDPMFTDDVHHDERAARIIGRAMFQALRPTLDRILSAPSPPTDPS